MVDQVAKALVAAAMELHRRRPWLRVPADAPIVVHVPGEEHPLVAVIIGQDRSDFGLVVFRGANAFSSFDLVVTADSEDAFAPQCDMLGVTFDPLSSIPPELREVLKSAGFSCRRESVAPAIYVQIPDHPPREPRRQEMRLLVQVLRSIFAAEDAGDLRPVSLDDDAERVLELRLESSREKKKERVVAGRVEWPDSPEIPSCILGLPEDIAELPRLDQTWILSLPTFRGAVDDDGRACRAIMIMDEASGIILSADVMSSGDLRPVSESFAQACRGGQYSAEAGLPREVLFSSPMLHNALAPALADLGIDVGFCELPQAAKDMVEALARGPHRMNEHEPRSIDYWKEVDKKAAALISDTVCSELLADGILTRYFGSKDVATKAMSELSDLGVVLALMEWAFCDYRSRKGARTLLEKALQRKHDPSMRALLEARQAAVLSIYRVDSIEPGAGLVVEDVLDGTKHTVQDRAMSGCDLEGLFLPLRLLRIAGWTFPCVAGPPLPSLLVDRAVEYLNSMGAELPARSSTRSADLFGRLWGWLLDRKDQKVTLQNTDGDPLELQTAVFRLSSPGEAVAALAAVPGLQSEDDGTWTWLREGELMSGMEMTVLARLEVFDDVLMLEVNSAKRLQRARAWIEELPGVTFESVRARDVDDYQAPDDLLPSAPPRPLSARERQNMERQFVKTCQRWLDTPVPLLGNMTPRKACETDQGRRRVARMIRTMPPMHIPGGSIPVPRALLLKDLGIES